MNQINIFVFVLSICFVKCEDGVDYEKYEFPVHFKFGVATSAYQVEGGWNASDKGENIWDRFTHTNPEYIADKSNGDISCDSYHKWKTDVKNLKNLGVDFYRFSFSWTRILPTGYANYVSEEGVNYYNNLIDRLIEDGIEPIATIYHWDLPQSLMEIGGWQNPQVAEYFLDFSRILFDSFGDRVKTWVTINEPDQLCESGYALGLLAPITNSPGIGNYLCTKYLLLAHAKVYRLYDEEFRPIQGGKIGISISSEWYEPLTDNPKDIETAKRAMEMTLGLWSHPIFSQHGDYPPSMKERIRWRSRLEKFPKSRLPELTVAEIALIKGSSDFFGINHYNTYMVEEYNYPIGEPSLESDIGFKKIEPSVGKDQCPWGLRKLLNWIKKEAGNPVILIMENGINCSKRKDKKRVHFLKTYLNEVLNSIVEDNCNVQAYTAWSFMDNMEWRFGYTWKYGLFHVDFSCHQRKRTPKLSASYYKTILNKRKIPRDFDECYAFDSEEECVTALQKPE